MKKSLQISAIAFLATIGSVFIAISYGSLSVVALMAVGIQRLIGDNSTTWKECMQYGSAALVDWDGTFFTEKKSKNASDDSTNHRS